ncbi:hypothetical protein D2N39_11645 [Gemmobacter lutimaris]|jgi:hypothetical protein|uniref:Uncharacterized protein n=1 Tax=Gemmobacter lutimaris TaxID=2306023 RepID=A0A398BN91_9RHOB|nr:hypothetical protein [Gemmobacter lutimaris]RID91882.1 hypothetical protein D2N39_11645 [Gemmobacter lutimaris]
MPLPFLTNLIIGFAWSFVGFLLQPGVKQEKPPATEDLEDPTAEAGRPIPVVVGSVRISGLNNLGHWDKLSVHRKADTGSKK